jgi:hypothetical protein
MSIQALQGDYQPSSTDAYVGKRCSHPLLWEEITQ